jgi:hypothetical protein
MTTTKNGHAAKVEYRMFPLSEILACASLQFPSADSPKNRVDRTKVTGIDHKEALHKKETHLFVMYRYNISPGSRHW